MRRPALAVTVLLLPLVLTGCSGAAGWLPHERHGTAASPQALEHAWSTPASEPRWLPQDATRIRWIAATRGGADRAPAALLARTSADLPRSCRAMEGAQGAAIAASWAPPRVAEVRRCGNWAVTAVDGGYYGWTPAEATATG